MKGDPKSSNTVRSNASDIGHPAFPLDSLQQTADTQAHLDNHYRFQQPAESASMPFSLQTPPPMDLLHSYPLALQDLQAWSQGAFAQQGHVVSMAMPGRPPGQHAGSFYSHSRPTSGYHQPGLDSLPPQQTDRLQGMWVQLIKLQRSGQLASQNGDASAVDLNSIGRLASQAVAARMRDALGQAANDPRAFALLRQLNPDLYQHLLQAITQWLGICNTVRNRTGAAARWLVDRKRQLVTSNTRSPMHDCVEVLKEAAQSRPLQMPLSRTAMTKACDPNVQGALAELKTTIVRQLELGVHGVPDKQCYTAVGLKPIRQVLTDIQMIQELEQGNSPPFSSPSGRNLPGTTSPASPDPSKSSSTGNPPKQRKRSRNPLDDDQTDPAQSTPPPSNIYNTLLSNPSSSQLPHHLGTSAAGLPRHQQQGYLNQERGAIEHDKGSRDADAMLTMSGIGDFDDQQQILLQQLQSLTRNQQAALDRHQSYPQHPSLVHALGTDHDRMGTHHQEQRSLSLSHLDSSITTRQHHSPNHSLHEFSRPIDRFSDIDRHSPVPATSQNPTNNPRTSYRNMHDHNAMTMEHRPSQQQHELSSPLAPSNSSLEHAPSTLHDQRRRSQQLQHGLSRHSLSQVHDEQQRVHSQHELHQLERQMMSTHTPGRPLSMTGRASPHDIPLHPRSHSMTGRASPLDHTPSDLPSPHHIMSPLSNLTSLNPQHLDTLSHMTAPPHHFQNPSAGRYMPQEEALAQLVSGSTVRSEDTERTCSNPSAQQPRRAVFEREQSGLVVSDGRIAPPSAPHRFQADPQDSVEAREAAAVLGSLMGGTGGAARPPHHGQQPF